MAKKRTSTCKNEVVVPPQKKKVLQTISQSDSTLLPQSETKTTLYTVTSTTAKRDSEGNWVLPYNTPLDAEKKAVYAKLEVRGERKLYYVRLDDRNRLYNPFGMYSGVAFGRYKSVSRKIFELYTSYLRTKDKWYYTQAEREYR